MHRCLWTIAVGIALIIVGTLYGGRGAGPSESATALHAPRAVKQPSAGPAVYSGHRRDFIASVYECRRRGERIFSDERCGSDARVRTIRDPSRMDIQDTGSLTRAVR
jgi:hypothetical protein